MSPAEHLPIVGVVTVTYNSQSVLEDFLDSAAAQTGVDMRLYVIDNDSHDESVAMVDAETRIEHLALIANADNVGVALGNNQGIEAALADGCEWVLLLNNDTKFPADLISTLVAEAVEHGLELLSPIIEGAVPAGSLWYGTGRYLESQGFRTWHPDGGEPMSAAPKELTRTQYASTCCLLVAPVVFRTAGLMDPDYFVYFDDVDFAVRANRKGFQYWVTPAVTLLHKANSLTGGTESPFALKWGSRNWVLISRKNHSGFNRLRDYAVIGARSLLRFLLRRDTRAEYGIRLAAFRDGATMKINDVPFPALELTR
jgi:GT2 family glycosyltransferase